MGNLAITHYSTIYFQGVLIDSLRKFNYTRPAGVCCQLLQKNKRFTKIKLPSDRM